MSIEEHRQMVSQNRNSLYHFFKEQEFDMRMMKIGKGTYKVFRVPYKWDSAYLLINDVRITDFDSVIIFSNELVVRFDKFTNQQINIPYKSIKTISVTDDLDLGYHELHLNK